MVPIGYEGEVRAAADRIHDRCGPGGVLLFDDPDRTAVERFAESDLLGISVKIVLVNHYRETRLVELEDRDGETRRLAPEDVPEAVERYAAANGDVLTGSRRDASVYASES